MTEIGKVSVRVMPNTKGFGQKVERDLKALKKLEKTQFKIDAKLNEDYFKAQLKRLIATTNLEMMKDENRVKIRASLEMSDENLRKEARSVRSRLQQLASEETVKYSAELTRSAKRRLGAGGLVGLDARGAVKDLERELQGKSYELPVYADTSKAMRDIRRMTRSNDFKIDVDLNVDRRAIHKDVESVSELIENTRKAMAQTKSLEFRVDVDRASVTKWAKEVKRVGAELKAQEKAYRQTQHELKIVTDRAEDYGDAVSAATKKVAKIKADQAADLAREEKLTAELVQLRETIAKKARSTADEVTREKRIVGQIEDMRRRAFEKSLQRTEAEARATEEIKNASREITRLKAKQAELSRQSIKDQGKLQSLAVDEKRLQKDLDRARNKLEMDAIDLDVNLDEVSFEAVGARLAALSRDRIVTLWTRVQRASVNHVSRQYALLAENSEKLAINSAKWIGQLTGVRVLWRTFKDMVEILPKLDMAVPVIAKNLALITAGTAGAIGGLGVLFTLISDIGEVGKLVIGLPAAIFGVAGSALIIGRAIEDFSNVFPEIIEFYKDLGNVVSGNVWDKAAGPVRKLHKSLTPLLEAHVPDWATTWGESMGAFADGLGSVNSLGNLEIFLKNSILGTKNAEKGWESLGSAIMSMVGGGSDVFPDLGTWFSDTMADFDEWAQENQATMSRWLREGGTALRELGSIGVSTVKVFAGVADAFDAAGWPGLTEFERAMRALGDGALTLKDNDAFMRPLEQVRGFFSEIKTLGPQAGLALKNAWSMMGEGVDTLSTPITMSLSSILDGFNSDKFQGGFTTFTEGLGQFLKDISPGLEAMTAEIGSLLGVVGTAGKSWGPAFNDMLLLFSSAGDKLHPGLIDFIENTGPDLQALVEDLTPHIEDFAESVSNLLGDADFQDLIGDLIGDLGTFLGVIIDLGTWITDTAKKFSDWYGGLSEGQQKFVRWSALFAAAFGGIALIAGRALVKIGTFLRNLGGSLRLFGDAFRTLGHWFKGTKLAGVLGGFADDIALRALYLIDKLKGLGGRIGTAMRNLFGKLRIPKLPSIGNIGATLARWLAPLGRALKGLPATLGKLLPKGGLSKLLGPALRGFLRFAGPIGWATLILELVKPLDFANLADLIVDALGFEDTWLGTMTESIKQDIEEMFGDKSLADIIIDNFKSSFDNFADGDIVGGITELVKGLFHGFNFVEIVGDAILNALGFSDEQIDLTKAEAGESGGIWNMAWEGVKDWLSDGWDDFLQKFEDWHPEWAWNLGEWIAGLIGDLFGGGNGGAQTHALGGEITADSPFVKWWENRAKPWLGEKWDELIELIKGWNPISLGFRFGTWIADNIKDWLGIGEGSGDGASFSFDFTSLWENKIKPALKTGLIGLVGLITAPGLILVAPLALPALIIGWLLGRDEEGNWSWGELTSKIEGAWEGIKGAISSGVETIKGLAEGLTFNPINVGKKVAEWVLGTDFGQKAKEGIEGAWDLATDPISAGMEAGKRAAEAALEEKGGTDFTVSGAWLTKMFGTDAPGIARIAERFGIATSEAEGFGTGVGLAYKGMGDETGFQLSRIGQNTEGEFGDMRVIGTRETDDLRSNVTGNFRTMQAQATARAAAMQAQTGVQMAKMAGDIISHTSRATSRAASEAADMNRRYVAQMQQMMAKAIRVAQSIRDALPRALTINATGPGNYTGSTFVRGLAGGLSRAVSVAYSIRSGIRSALSFSAYSSGSTVGGTFAAGISSRIGAVRRASYALAAASRRALPNSPADEGPFSGSGWGGWGESIGEELAKGLRQSAPEVAREAERMMAGVSDALETRSGAQVGIGFEHTRRRYGLASDLSSSEAKGTTINVNVESTSEDPLQDGNRLGNALDFALRGARFA